MTHDTRIKRARRMRQRALNLGMDRGLVAATPDAALSDLVAKLALLRPYIVDDAEPREPAQVIQFRVRRPAPQQWMPAGGDCA